MPRPKSKRNDVPVKIDAEVLRLVRIVSAYEDVSIAELVSETMRPIMERRLAEHQAKEGKSPRRPPPRP
jgi:hypothetical protein